MRTNLHFPKADPFLWPLLSGTGSLSMQSEEQKSRSHPILFLFPCVQQPSWSQKTSRFGWVYPCLPSSHPTPDPPLLPSELWLTSSQAILASYSHSAAQCSVQIWWCGFLAKTSTCCSAVSGKSLGSFADRILVWDLPATPTSSKDPVWYCVLFSLCQLSTVPCVCHFLTEK